MAGAGSLSHSRRWEDRGDQGVQEGREDPVQRGRRAVITGAQCFQGWGPWAGREDSDDYWGLVLSGLGGHGQRGRRVVITGAWCFQGWGAMGRQGWGTYSRTSITSATSRPRGTDGAWETIESIFARSTSRARGTLQGGSWLEKALRKAGAHPSSGREAHLPLCLAQTPQPYYGLFPRKLCGRKEWGGRGQRPHKVVHKPHSSLSSPAPDPSPER